MGGEWKKRSIHDVGKVITGKTPPGTLGEYFGGDTLFVTPGDMDEKKCITSSARTLSSSGVKAIKKIVFDRAVIVSCIGWQMGKSAVVKQTAATNQQINAIVVNESIVDIDFLYYVLKSKREEIFQLGATATRTPIVKKSLFEKISFLAPELSEQKRISECLSTLDDKIELNRQMNATLEAMAQALFKSWFVDFDPVIDNALAAGNPIPEPLQARAEMRKGLGEQRKPLPAEIQRQFPSRFVFTEEMGWVPEGWGVGAFRDIAVHIRDNVKAEVVGDFDFYIGLEHIGRKQLFLTESGTGDSIESNKSQFAEYDLLFGKLRPYFHKVSIAPQEGICSTDILVFRAKQPSLHAFMTMTAFRDEFVEYADIRSTGTRMPRANAKDMLAYPIIIPSAPLMAEFEKMVSLHWVRGMQSANESHELAKLRDALLPKLLSGQLRIPEAEAMIERAGVAV